MSGEHFSFTAKVDLDGVEYVGCAREGWDSQGQRVTDYRENASTELQPSSKTLTLDVLKNAQYQSEFSAKGGIKLSDGVYKEKVVPDAATELVVTLGDKIAFGDLNGDGDNTDGGAESALDYINDDDVFIVKFDSGGAYQWSKRLSGYNADRGKRITNDLSNNMFM